MENVSDGLFFSIANDEIDISFEIDYEIYSPFFCLARMDIGRYYGF